MNPEPAQERPRASAGDILPAPPDERLATHTRYLQRLKTPKQRALEKARAARKEEAPRKPPIGYRDLEHFLRDLAETVKRRPRGVQRLAIYVGTNDRLIRAWVAREKIPMQESIDQCARWIAEG